MRTPLRLLLLALAAAACGPLPGPFDEADAGPHAGTRLDAGRDPEPIDNVIFPVYLAANDMPQARAQERAAKFGEAVRAVSGWYGRMILGAEERGFRVHAPVVVKSPYPRATWNDWALHGWQDADGSRPHGDGCGMWYGAWNDLANRMEAWVSAGLPPPKEGRFYVVLTGGGTGGGCGAGNLSAVEDMLLDRIDLRCPSLRYDTRVRACFAPGDLGRSDPWCSEWPHDTTGYECAGIGALAHEIGHGLGLPHCKDRRECTGAVSIMDEWWEWGRNRDAVSLSDQDRADLLRSPYFPH